MKAAVGDRIVIAANRVDGPLRDGEVIACPHEDGSPPYEVQWSDTGKTGLFFPGPDALVTHRGDPEPAPPADRSRVKSWRVDVDVFESDDGTAAHAVLTADVAGLEARGVARRNPHDADMPLVGDEVAVARALRRLADRLLDTASDEISVAEGRPVELDS